MQPPSMQHQPCEWPEQRRTQIEDSSEQRSERGLRQPPSARAPSPTQGAYSPPQGAYQRQPPIIVQNFYQTTSPMPLMMQSPVVVDTTTSSPNFLLRALWFIFIGWWVGLIWLHVGFVLCATVIFLPLGLLMLNRLPTVLTLQPEHAHTTVTTYQNGIVAVQAGQPAQIDFLLRALYFILIGWWLGYGWAVVGYIFCFTIVLMPIGVMMLNRLPTILTLRQI